MALTAATAAIWTITKKGKETSPKLVVEKLVHSTVLQQLRAIGLIVFVCLICVQVHMHRLQPLYQVGYGISVIALLAAIIVMIFFK